MGGCAASHVSASLDAPCERARSPSGTPAPACEQSSQPVQRSPVLLPAVGWGRKAVSDFGGILCTAVEDRKGFSLTCSELKCAAVSTDEDSVAKPDGDVLACDPKAKEQDDAETASEVSRMASEASQATSEMSRVGSEASRVASEEQQPSPESSKQNADLYIGIPECKAEAKDFLLPALGITVGVTEETKGVEKSAEKSADKSAEKCAEKSAEKSSGEPLAKTLLQSDQGRTKTLPKLPIIPRNRSEPELNIPVMPRAKSAPVMLPAAAVRSRSAPRPELVECSPTPTAAMLPAQKSPTTALAMSRRKKRRCVTFGEAECREFLVDGAAEEAGAIQDGLAA